MARRAAAESAKSGAKGRSKNPRVVVWGVLGLLAATVLVLTAIKIEQFLITDQRFIIAGRPEPGRRSPDFQVTGNYYTTEEQIESPFARDFGRSVYLCPIAQRRQQLLAIDWVEEATVSGIWPNRVSVAVRERKPVAFVQVEGRDGAMVPMLVDPEGMLLSAPRAVRLKLPVLAGIRMGDTPETRRQRVKRFLALQQELGPLMDKISEVDVADLDNLKVTQQFEGRAVVLMLGSQKFEPRMRNLMNNYAEIRKRLPNATVLDLRLPDRVIAVSERAAADEVRR
jgi:cell division protein FtsQ